MYGHIRCGVRSANSPSSMLASSLPPGGSEAHSLRDRMCTFMAVIVWQNKYFDLYRVIHLKVLS